MPEWMGFAALFFLLYITVKLFEIARSLVHISTVVSRLLTFLGEEAGRQRNDTEIARMEARRAP